MILNLKKLKKSNLNLIQFLLLNTLYNKPDIELDLESGTIAMELEDKGFIRLIGTEIIINPTTKELFEDKYEKDAKLVLEYFNELKATYNISSRKHKYSSHGTEIKARLVEHSDSVEDIKKMLDIMFEEWCNKEPEMKKYLRPDTLFSRKKYPNYMDRIDLENNSLDDNLYERVEDE